MDSYMTAIGIIQGRLSEPVADRIQAFPKEAWEKEFESASTLGLTAIEWIFEDPIEKNPLWTAEGRAHIRRLAEQSRIRVDQVCADYFMEHPFFRVPDEECEQSVSILKQLILHSAEIGANSIEIPLLDNSRIETEEEMQAVIKIMKDALPVAAENNLVLAFETSLEPERFVEFMRKLDHPNARVVYDIGNSASLGYNTTEEISMIGKYLSNVHVKDRSLGGSTVPLGTGNAKFGETFSALKQAGYTGHYTLQIARGERGRELETTRSHLDFLKKYL